MKYEFEGEVYEVNERGGLIRPKEIEHLKLVKLNVLFEMEKKGGAQGELSKKEQRFRDAVYSTLGQG